MTFIVMTVNSFAQNVGINTTGNPPNSRALLDLDQAGTGLLIPRMVKADRDTITSIPTSLLIYQTNDTAGYYYYDGTAWVRFSEDGANGWTDDGTVVRLTNGTDSVGIGTTSPTHSLHVNAGIRIGNTSTGNAGAIRWNTTSNDFEGFNGTRWRSLTGIEDRTLIYTNDGF